VALPAGRPAQPVARQAGRVVAHRQAQPAGRRVARAVRRQAPVADLRVRPMTARQAPVVARPEALPVRQATPRHKRPDKLAVQPAPRDPTRRAVPTAVVLQRRRAAIPGAQQAPTRAACHPQVTGQRQADPLAVMRLARRVLDRMERKAVVRRRPVPVPRQAAKRRSSAMTVNRVAARKRIPPVRRERAVQPPASRAQVRLPPKVLVAKAPARIPPRVRARMPVAARVRMVRPATVVRQAQRPAIRRAVPTAACQPRCQPACPARQAVLRGPMAAEARALRPVCLKGRVARARPPAIHRVVEPQAVRPAVEPATAEPAVQVAVPAGVR